MLSKDPAYLTHGPQCNQRRGLLRDPACHRAPWRSPDYSGETEAEVVRTCLPITRPGTDHLARHCGGSKKKGKAKEAVRRQRQRVDRTGLSRVTEGCWRQTEMEAAGQGVDRTGLSRVTEGCWRQTEMEAAGCETRRWCPHDPPGKGTDRDDHRHMHGSQCSFFAIRTC